MPTSRLLLTLGAILPLAACVLNEDSDAVPTSSSTTDETTSSEPATQGSSSSTQGGSSSSTGSNDTSTSVSESSSGADESSTGDPLTGSCETASLLLGSPYFDGELGQSNAAGQGLTDEPPLRSRHLALVDNRLAIETQFEVWLADDTQVHRIAGNENSETDRYRPTGSCSQMRILLGAGIAGLPDGRLIVTDYTGNGVIELRDLMGECTAAVIAGNPDETLVVDIEGVGAPGDIDGPGADARFWGVSRPTADNAGNVYVIDKGNGKIKRIADDEARTVTTLHDFSDEGTPLAMTAMQGTLWVVGVLGSVDDALWAVDTDTGATELVYAGTGLFAEIDSQSMALMHSITNDGEDLIVGSNRGYVFRLSTQGQSKGPIAGYGKIIDYPSDLDLSGTLPSNEIPIDSYSLDEANLLRMGNDILFTNNANGVGYHVWAIHCG